MKPQDELKFPDWWDNALFDELEELGFNCDISWDSLGRITLHIWRMTEQEKQEHRELDAWLKEFSKELKKIS